MDAGSSRWNEVTPSQYPHERAALEYVRDLLPDRSPYQAWSNFTFTSGNGHVREVDLLVVAPSGMHLVEIKSWHGRLSNDGAIWTRDAGRGGTADNPLPLADQKAKELKGLLQPRARRDRVQTPFIRASIFLSEPGMVCELDEQQRQHVYAPDHARNGLDRIGADLLTATPRHAPPDPAFVKRLPEYLKQAGVHRTRRSMAIGPWRLDPRPYESGPTWQDHHATRDDMGGEDRDYRRVRIYLYQRQTDDESRESVRRAAQREYRAGRGIEHPGLLVPDDLHEHDLGPALMIRQHPQALRLDHWLVRHEKSLDLPTRVGLVRQLAEAVNYAHQQRLVHRALSPRAVVVEPREEGPRLRVGEWQAAARGLSSSASAHRVEPTSHAGLHVEEAAQAYLAPEFTSPADGTSGIDVFGLGAISYLLLTGKAPARTRAELFERLRAEDGLRPFAVDDSIPHDLDLLVGFATCPTVTERPDDVEEFLGLLGDAEQGLRGSVHPDVDAPDPLDAQAGDELPEGYHVVRPLGSGSTARAFLVARDGQESVLKVGRTDEAARRLDDEATVLEGLTDEHVVTRFRGAFPLGPRRTAIELSYAGEQSLAELLRTEGSLVPDALQRFGDQLLDAVAFLHERDVFHRDVKPDNIGIRRDPKRGPILVLFDFSLAGAPLADVAAGTNGYRDPHLGSARRPIYDEAAELYALAATLHEMASLELPSWSDDGTDAAFGELRVSTDLFDQGVRGPLTTFFTRALHRDADQRYSSAGALREAWGKVFAAADDTRPASITVSSSEDADELREEAAAKATLDTALNAAGLSERAVAVAQRLGASTVGELVEVPVKALWRARGLSKATRTEMVQRAADWRRRLGAPARPATPAPVEVDALEPLDRITARLVDVPTSSGVDRGAILRAALGLPDADGTLPAVRWPTSAAVGERFGLTGQRITQILGDRRRAWLREADVQQLRSDLVDLLTDRARVAAASELAEEVLSRRGCVGEDDPQRRRAHAYAVVRAVVEADGLADEPRFALRRHRDRVLVALQVGEDESLDTPSDAQLLDMAAAAADAAVELAGRDPLPTPTAVVRELAAVQERHDLGLAEHRLVQLAAAAAGTVLSNARLELYPHDLDRVRALRLAQAGAGVQASGVTEEVVTDRVQARFPGLAALPRGAELVDLLTRAQFDVHWNGERIVPPSTHLGESVVGTPSSVSGHAATPIAGGVDARVRHVLTGGGVRMVTTRRSRWAATRARLSETVGVEVRDVSTEFVRAVRAVATEAAIPDFGIVLHADDADAPDGHRSNLDVVVARAFARLAAEWHAQDVLVLDGLTPLGRYAGGMAVLAELLDHARRGGTGGGPTTVVLLCPAEDDRQPPHIDRQAIGMVSAEEWVVATSAWLHDPVDAA